MAGVVAPLSLGLVGLAPLASSETARAAVAAGPGAGASQATANGQSRGSVGLKPRTKLRPSGPVTIRRNGTVLKRLDIRGGVRVEAKRVKIRNSRIRGNGTGNGVQVTRGGSVVIKDSEISDFSNGIAYSNWTARRVEIHSMTADGVKLGSNVKLLDSWIHDLTPGAGAHADGGQVQSGVRNTKIVGNTIDAGRGNAALFISPSLGPSSSGPVKIRDNSLDGGNFTLFVVDGAHGKYVIKDIRVVGNVFGRNHRYGASRTNVPVRWRDNRYADTLEAIRR